MGAVSSARNHSEVVDPSKWLLESLSTVRTIIGVISDTHGLIRPEAVRALSGARLIIHAGDVGRPAVLEALGAIGPVHGSTAGQ